MNYDNLIDEDTLGTDADLVHAGQILGEIAKTAGVDLNDLSDGDIADLLVQLQGGAQPQSKLAADTAGENTMSNQITYADVAAELAKIAQDQGIDMSKVSREEYHEAYDAMALQMQQPDYAEQKLAQDEAMAKLAEADVIGRQMAQSFMDEMKTAGAVGNAMNTAKGKLNDIATSVGRRTTTAKGQSKMLKNLGNISGEADNQAARDLIKDQFASRGKKVLGGAAALGATGIGAAGIASRKKESAEEQFESEALALAEAYVAEKTASYEDLVAQRAIEILEANGVEL